MISLKSFALFLLLALLFLGWQITEQYDAFAAVVGLPITPKLSASDQFIIS